MKLRELWKKTDKLLLFSSLVLFVFGLIMIYSSSTVAATRVYKEANTYFVLRQGLTEAFMLFLTFFLIIRIPIDSYKKIPIWVYWAVMIGVLILLALFGTEANGAKSWFEIGGRTFQPSEFCKTGIIMYLAFCYGSIKSFKNEWFTVIPMVLPAIVFVFVFGEPDLGTSLIILAVSALIYLKLPLKNWGVIKLGFAVLIVGGAFVFLMYKSGHSLLTPSQESRLTYKNPCSRYLEETGYQVCNSYIAMNNGGFVGLGLGNSKQKFLYLPESYTDFIFPVVVEEFGLVGTAILFLLFLILLFSILSIARNANNLTNSIIAFGTFSYILVHLVVNLVGVTGLFVMTGVPLPFISFGGSFVINLMFLLGLTQRVAIENKTKVVINKKKKA